MRYNPRMNRGSETLVGSIERVTYHNADNGFAVLKTAANSVAVRSERPFLVPSRGG